MFIIVCVRASHGMHVEVTGQRTGPSPPSSPYGSWGLHSGCQTGQQAHLPAVASHRPMLVCGGFVIIVFWFGFLETGFLCSSDCPRTHSVD